jgi:hypothetical protein
MTGLALCGLAFVGVLLLARRSVGAGMAGLLATGYFYGILRARFLDGFSHFMFDAAVLGLYLAHFQCFGLGAPRTAPELFSWTTALLAWPFVVLALGPLYPQHLLIQVVGLRAAIWFLPFLLVGARARPDDLTVIAAAFTVLNLVALAFGFAEYSLGLEAFFPRNAVTELMYRSRDIAGYTAYRIPATFSSSAAYGGVMVASLPLLMGRCLASDSGLVEKLLLLASVLAAAVGVFLCGSRTPVLFLFAMGLVVAYQFRARLGYLAAVVVVAAVVMLVVRGSERLQRFTSLQDQEMVSERIRGSANVGVIGLMLESPLGGGLGSAFGTSIPSFLADVAPEPIGAENELARIAIETTLVGLALWLGFLTWLLSKRTVKAPGGWQTGITLMWLFVLMSWGTALIGCGTLTAIPGTPLLLFQMGVIAQTRRLRFPAGTPPATPAPGGAT